MIMNKKIFIVLCFFYVSGPLYAVKSTKVMSFVSKMYDSGYTSILKTDIFGISTAYSISNNVDVGCELTYYTTNIFGSDLRCFLCTAYCKHFFELADNECRLYIRYLSGLRKMFVNNTRYIPSEILEQFHAIVGVVGIGCGVDFKITDNVFVNTGIDISLRGRSLLGQTSSYTVIGTVVTFGVGVGFTF